MLMMHPLISFSSLQDKTVLSLEVGKLKRAAAKVQRFENFEEDLDDEYRKSFCIDTGRHPLTKRPPNWQPLNWQPPLGRKGEGPKIFHISDDFEYFVGLEELEQELLS